MSATMVAGSALGVVTRRLLELLAQQVREQKIVVWYDPGAEYAAVAEGLATDAELRAAVLRAGTEMVRYDGSFFALRREVEPQIAGLEPPLLLVYVPLDRRETQEALVELEALGTYVQPNQQPPARNTRLAVVARRALAEVLGAEGAQAIEKQVEQGKLTLAELDSLAERGENLRTGVISLLYEGQSQPREIALAFLTRPEIDPQLKERDALGELVELLQAAFGLAAGPPTEEPEALRQRFARHALVSDLRAGLPEEAFPPALAAVPCAETAAAREACAGLAREFRLRRDLGAEYAEHALRVEKELELASLRFERSGGAAGVETFREIERQMQESVETALLAASETPPATTETLGDLVGYGRERQRCFWSEQDATTQARWALIAAAGEVLGEAQRIERAVAALPAGARQGTETPEQAGERAATLLAAYTAETDPWCLLDTYHRHMERRWHAFDPDVSGETHQRLEQLIGRARQQYMAAGGALAEVFGRAAHRGRARWKEQPPLALRQREVFAQCVRPHLLAQREKVAYFLVDALRYEMGRELAQSLEADFRVTIEPALATLPTITEIGMAALMPGADDAATALIPGAAGKVALEIGGKPLRNRKERLDHLIEYARSGFRLEVCETKLEALIPRPNPRLQRELKRAGSILVTSQEIDTLCEAGNVHLARRTMDEMLKELSRAFRLLAELGVTHIVCVADHGYLFGDELDEDMKMEAPGGETVDLHRRVWVGRGGTSEPGYLRARAAEFGLAGDLELAFPLGFAGFRAGGASAYLHGGLSPQEMVVPVLTLTPVRAAATEPVVAIAWELRLGSKKITTRFCSVQVAGTAQGLFPIAVPPRVRVEVRVGSDVISEPVSASYGFQEATRDVQLQLADSGATGGGGTEPNTVTLMLTPGAGAATATIHLLDAGTGKELAQLGPVELAISL